MKTDVVVVGAGPNGLSAAIEIARAGISVTVMEAAKTIGGGTRTAELTLPGFLHDVCSAIHPMAVLSPFFQKLDLRKWQLDWIFPPASLAHPLPDGSAAILYPDLDRTAEALGKNSKDYKNLMLPFVRPPDFFSDLLGPIGIPRHPFLFAKFGLLALRSCTGVAKSHLRSQNARALFAGCAGHSFLPLSAAGSASFGLALAIAGHVAGWPCVSGGSQKIADALAQCLQQSGGQIQTGVEVRSMRDLPEARAYLFDLTPRQIVHITQDLLPSGYRNRLLCFRYGPGVFKMDWALAEPIPWTNPDCAQSATVHIGGTLEEIANAEEEVSRGKHPEHPFIILAQQSLFDSSRAPQGKHTAWAYCHVPNGSTIDMSEQIERQIDRFAPGFRDVILARHSFTTRQMEAHNANFIGGDISGGANTLRQIIARPVVRLDPYSTPHPKLFLCSSSTPPGGGVHGMCGYHAAQSVLKRVFGIR